jgi:hypothetical protein
MIGSLFCLLCGADIPRDSKFCCRCGTSLAAGAEMTDEAQQPGPVLQSQTVSAIAAGNAETKVVPPSESGSPNAMSEDFAFISPHTSESNLVHPLSTPAATVSRVPINPRVNRVGWWVGLPGFILLVAGNVLSNPLLSFLGLIVFFVGLAYYAKGKGRSAWWCLWGLAGIIGWLVLASLEIRTLFTCSGCDRGLTERTRVCPGCEKIVVAQTDQSIRSRPTPSDSRKESSQSSSVRLACATIIGFVITVIWAINRR